LSYTPQTMMIAAYVGSGGPSQSPFGAYGDGMHDDTAAIQAAIDSVSATGGWVFFDPVPYKITSSLNVRHTNTNLVGQSRGLSG
jgi:polygalacturonase